jgi:hypothetical protein
MPHKAFLHYARVSVPPFHLGLLKNPFSRSIKKVELCYLHKIFSAIAGTGTLINAEAVR